MSSVGRLIEIDFGLGARLDEKFAIRGTERAGMAGDSVVVIAKFFAIRHLSGS
jgi:hypothetical protein